MSSECHTRIMIFGAKGELIELGHGLLPSDRYMTCPPDFKRPAHFRNKIQLTLKSGKPLVLRM